MRTGMMIRELPKDDMLWSKTIPNYKNAPNNLDNLMFGVKETDFLQHTYQNYYLKKISEADFNNLKESWNWEPNPNEYTKDFVNLYIGVVAGYDSSNTLTLLVDKNNNYDFEDDTAFSVIKNVKGQGFWDRYNDNIPFEVEYEFFDGKSIKKSKAWFYIDYSSRMLRSNDAKAIPIELFVDFAEHHLGEFNINGSKYYAAAKSDRAVFRTNYTIKVWNENNPPEVPNQENGVSKDGFVRIDEYYYKLADVSIDGSTITLVKDVTVAERGGNQIGLKALNIVGETTNGTKINLSMLKGNYVLLDFWGSWCKGCETEMPVLKKLYEKYKAKNFKMIGIVNDSQERLKKYIDQNEILWEQILQDKDKSIISDYGVYLYPTKILIDENGVIINKYITAAQLSDILNNIFNEGI